MHPTTPLLKRTALRRLPLTTKQGPHNFYKGNRTGAMGRHTKHGGYVIMWEKVRTYVVPDLKGFRLTPFVAKKVHKERDSFRGTESGGPLDGREYLRRWKEAGGKD